MKHRISQKLLTQLPAAVAGAIRDAADRHGIKSLTHVARPAGFAYIAGEGERITAVYRGEAMCVEMVAEHTVGASGVRHEIGARIPLPVGAVLVVVGYMSGYYLTLYTVGDAALPAPGRDPYAGESA